MIVNQEKAISTSKILLVPYEPHHVLTYHSWMEDEELRAVTASELLSLEEEYKMQITWRTDPDKLTFIACLPLPPSFSVTAASPSSSPKPSPPLTPTSDDLDLSPRKVISGTDDGSIKMIGDINLFLTPDIAESPGVVAGNKTVIGEISIMIASIPFRRQGYGRATLLAFMKYIEIHADEILHEYQSTTASHAQNPFNDTAATDIASLEPGSKSTLKLTAKIQSSNVESIALFRGVGFGLLNEGEENVWGEVEMEFDGMGAGDEKEVDELQVEKNRVCGFEELEYFRG